MGDSSSENRAVKSQAREFLFESAVAVTAWFNPRIL